MEDVTAEFSRFSATDVKICFSGGWLKAPHQIPALDFLEISKFLKILSLKFLATCEAARTFTF